MTEAVKTPVLTSDEAVEKLRRVLNGTPVAEGITIERNSEEAIAELRRILSELPELHPTTLPAEKVWLETIPNDGTYEYTTTSDCDGSNVKHWRRLPELHASCKPSKWEEIDSPLEVE